MADGFSFNFDETEKEQCTLEQAKEGVVDQLVNVALDFLNFRSPRQIQLTDADFYSEELLKGKRIVYRKPPHIPQLEGDKDDAKDIVEGKYFGGLKLWNCSLDLARYCLDSGVSGHILTEKHLDRVLELGCGHGLPGIACMMRGASPVAFQDFNREVIDECTIPNLLMNFPGQHLPVALTCAADWKSFDPHYHSSSLRFSCILGSDVTFDANATLRFLTCAVRLMDPQGIILVGTKEYYFGTGGGIAEIESCLAKLPCLKGLTMKVLQKIPGEGMPRLIVCLSMG